MSLFTIHKPIQELLKIPKGSSNIVAIEPAKTLEPAETNPDKFVYYEFFVEVRMNEAEKLGASYLVLDLLPDIPAPPKPSALEAAAGAQVYIKGMRADQYLLRQYRLRVENSVFAKGFYNLGRDFRAKREYIKKPPTPRTVIDADDFAGKFRNPSIKVVEAKMPFVGVSKSLFPLDDVDLPARVNDSKSKGSKQKKYNPKVPQYGGVGKNKKPTASKILGKAVKSGVDPAQIKVTGKTKMMSVVKQPALAKAASFLVYTPPTVAPLPSTYLFKPVFEKKKVRVRIPESIANDFSTFVVRASLKNSKGVVIQRKVFPVQHARNVNAFITPDFPPLLKASPLGPAKVSIDITQKDKKGTRVKVFRRTCPASDGTNMTGSSWRVIADAELAVNEKITFSDQIAYSGKIMYRALTYGSNGKPGEQFSSAVVTTPKSKPIRSALVANARFVEQRSDSPVTIRVTDIPPGDNVTMVRLQRYDVTYDSRRERRSGTGAGFTYIGGNKSAVGLEEVVFQDTTAQSGRQYEYLPVGISPTVGTIYGVPYQIVIPQFTAEPMVAIQVSAPRVPPLSKEFGVVEIELGGEFTNFGFNKIKDTLAAKGQEQLYSDQIEKNRSEFGKLISFVVDREDHKTGDIETFGIVDPGTFTDNKESRAKLGISDPVEGVEYSYSVTALLSTSDNMFPRVSETTIDTETLGIVKETLSKLSSPLTKKTGVIPSTARQYDLTAKDKIFPVDPRLAGITNIQKKVPFLFAPPTNTVKDVTVSEFHSFNRISWVFDGPLEGIDHFRIEFQCGGGSVLIDTVHCDPEAKKFFYRHKDIGYSMNYQYKITPVNLRFFEITSAFTRVIDASMMGITQKIDSTAIKALSSKGLPDFQFPDVLGAIKL